MKRWGEKRVINILVYEKTDVNSGRNINKVRVMSGKRRDRERIRAGMDRKEESSVGLMIRVENYYSRYDGEDDIPDRQRRRCFRICRSIQVILRLR